MAKVSIHIDGANFYLLALKPLGIHDADFDYEGLINMLADGREVAHLGKRYYIGAVSEKEGDQDIQLWVYEPPKPLNVKIYRW